MVLRVYGHIVSQPTRAVLSFLKANNIVYEFVPINPLAREHQTPHFKAINPLCQIPAIEDGDVKLGESHAILVYLQTTRKCPDFWYPQDAYKRALVNRYLHWHHSNLRRGFLILFARIPGAKVSETAVSEATLVFNRALKTMEEMLTANAYLAGASPSLADLSAFCELDQHTVRGIDLTAYPKLQEWMKTIGALPGVKEVHDEMVQFWGTLRSKRAPRSKL